MHKHLLYIVSRLKIIYAMGNISERVYLTRNMNEHIDGMNYAKTSHYLPIP